MSLPGNRRTSREPGAASSPPTPAAAVLLWVLLAGSLPGRAAQPGEVLWQHQAEGGMFSCPAIGADGTVYVATTYGVYALGGATSTPIVAVVSNVDPQTFPTYRWQASGATADTLESASVLQPGTPWEERGQCEIGTSSGVYSATNPLAAVRFYRLRGDATARFTATALIPGWWYQLGVGSRHRIEYVWSGSGWTNWIELTELTLPASPHLFLDTDAFDHPGAVYRTTPVP